MRKHAVTGAWLFIAMAVVLMTSATACEAAGKKSQKDPVQAKSAKLPEYLGVYVVNNGELIELKKHPQSTSFTAGGGTGIGGMDLLNSIPGTHFSRGNLQFIIFAQNPPSEVSLKIIVPVRKQITFAMYGSSIDEIKDIEGAYWTVLPSHHKLRIAPVSENPQMMVRAVPEESLSPGAYAVIWGSSLYDFSIEGQSATTECVDRVIQMMQVKYLPCAESDKTIAEIQQEKEAQRDRDEQAKRQKEELEARLPKGKREREVALINAAINGDLASANDLITAGTNINTWSKGVRGIFIRGWLIGEDGGTPLMFASANGHTEIVKLLLDKGANVNARTVYGEVGVTALKLAKRNDHDGIVRLLEEAGARK